MVVTTYILELYNDQLVDLLVDKHHKQPGAEKVGEARRQDKHALWH